MKNLVKLTLAVMMIVFVVGCNKKEVKVDKSKIQQEALEKEAKKAFISNANTLNNDEATFFEDFFKERELSLWEGLNEYALIQKGTKITYSRDNGKIYSGILPKNILAIMEGDNLIIDGGNILDWDGTGKQIFVFELHQRPYLIHRQYLDHQICIFLLSNQVVHLIL